MPSDPLRVEVRGFRELSLGTLRLAAKIDDGAQEAFLSTAEQTASAVRARVPKRTGRLARSVRAVRIDKGASVRMGAGLPYAGWIEYGGGHGRAYIDAGRYLNPTAEAAEPVFKRSGETAARKEIRGMTWPPPVL